MSKMFQLISLISAVVLIVAVAGFIVSSRSTVEPTSLYTAEKTQDGQANEKVDKTLWENFFPNSIAIFNFFLLVFTAVLAFVGLFQLHLLNRAEQISAISANAAKKAADVAEGTLVATQRPWIKIKSISIVSPLIFEPTADDHEGRVDLEFVLQNTGNTPAMRVALNTKLTISNTIDLREEQKVYCNAIRNSRKSAALNPSVVQPEITLFPQDEISIKTVAWMNSEPLANFREWAGKVPGAIVFPAVVGCLFYEFTFSKGHHQTGIIYDIYKRTPYPVGHPLPGYANIPPDFPITNAEGAIHLEGTIPASDLALRQNFVGSGPID